MESVNSRVKTWKYLGQVLPNSQIPVIGDVVKIVCAICNKYRAPLSYGEVESDDILGCKMMYLAKQINQLQEHIENSNIAARRSKWQKVDESDLMFPMMTEEELRNITLGVYQLKLARSYSQEHMIEEGGYEVYVCKVEENIISAKIQSRHTSSKSHQLWIRFDECSVQGWYCKCKAGARVVGTCAHVASVIWFLGFARHTENGALSRRKDWSNFMLDAANIAEPIEIDGSDDSCIEE